MHREVGGSEAARTLRPGRTPGGCNDGLQHRHIGFVEWRRLAGSRGRGECSRGDDDGRLKPRQRRAHELGCRAILQARNHQRSRCETPFRQRSTQRIDRCRVGRQQHRAVEDDRHAGTAALTERDESVEVDGAFTGDVTARTRHRAWLGRFDARSRMSRKPPKQRSQILLSTFAEKAQQRVEFVGRQRGGFGQARVIAILARQNRKCDGAFARKRRQPLDAVTPPVESAKQADHDDLCVPSHGVEPKIDREWMAQIPQVCEPNRGKHIALRRPGSRKAGQIAVGERQNDDVTG